MPSMPGMEAGPLLGARYSEAKDCRCIVFSALREDGGRKTRLVRRVRVVLGFEAEAGVLAVGLSRLTLDLPIQKVACIELNPRLGGQHFQHPARLRLQDAGGQ